MLAKRASLFEAKNSTAPQPANAEVQFEVTPASEAKRLRNEERNQSRNAELGVLARVFESCVNLRGDAVIADVRSIAQDDEYRLILPGRPFLLSQDGP